MISFVSTERGTVVTVEPWPERDAGYYVVSHNFASSRRFDLDPPPASYWRDPVAEAVKERLAEGGAGKGRVLYAYLARYLFQEDECAGVLCYHLEDGCIRVMRMAAAPGYEGSDARQVLVRLLECAQAIALGHGAPCLEWMVHSDRHVAPARRDYEFNPVSRRDPRCRELRRNQFLLERAHLQ